MQHFSITLLVALSALNPASVYATDVKDAKAVNSQPVKAPVKNNVTPVPATSPGKVNGSVVPVAQSIESLGTPETKSGNILGDLTIEVLPFFRKLLIDIGILDRIGSRPEDHLKLDPSEVNKSTKPEGKPEKTGKSAKPEDKPAAAKPDAELDVTAVAATLAEIRKHIDERSNDLNRLWLDTVTSARAATRNATRKSGSDDKLREQFHAGIANITTAVDNSLAHARKVFIPFKKCQLCAGLIDLGTRNGTNKIEHIPPIIEIENTASNITAKANNSSIHALRVPGTILNGTTTGNETKAVVPNVGVVKNTNTSIAAGRDIVGNSITLPTNSSVPNNGTGPAVNTAQTNLITTNSSPSTGIQPGLANAVVDNSAPIASAGIANLVHSGIPGAEASAGASTGTQPSVANAVVNNNAPVASAGIPNVVQSGSAGVESSAGASPLNDYSVGGAAQAAAAAPTNFNSNTNNATSSAPRAVNDNKTGGPATATYSAPGSSGTQGAIPGTNTGSISTSGGVGGNANNISAVTGSNTPGGIAFPNNTSEVSQNSTVPTGLPSNTNDSTAILAVNGTQNSTTFQAKLHNMEAKISHDIAYRIATEFHKIEDMFSNSSKSNATS